jgi:hypothetical protein
LLLLFAGYLTAMLHPCVVILNPMRHFTLEGVPHIKSLLGSLADARAYKSLWGEYKFLRAELRL